MKKLIHNKKKCYETHHERINNSSQVYILDS